MSNSICDSFEPVSAKAWKQKIQFELLGQDYNKTLLTQTLEGITIKPFYHADDFEKLQIPVLNQPTKICQQFKITTEIETNTNAINALNNGVKAFKFEAQQPFNFEQLFSGLTNKKIEFHFYFRFLSETFTHKLSEFLKNEIIFLNIDIIGNLAKTGNWYTSLNTDFISIENLIQQTNSANVLAVNAGLYQNAGANMVQQVAYALAHANEYFNKFGGKIGGNIQFNFATGSNFFFEIAKLRAFRYLYQLIFKEYGETKKAIIFCEPSLRNKTAHFNLNKLRKSNESLSAIYGGATTVSVDFFENKIVSETAFLTLQSAATDSYYIESITKQIAEKALQIFKEIEKAGGFLSVLKEGTIQRKIVENAKKEQALFNNGELVLIGANKYENHITESSIELIPSLKRKKHKTLIIPIIPTRLSEKLEQKRFSDEA